MHQPCETCAAIIEEQVAARVDAALTEAEMRLRREVISRSLAGHWSVDSISAYRAEVAS